MAQLYVLAFPNGKSYVGITNETVAERYGRHFVNAYLDDSQCAVHRAMRKHGVPRVVPIMCGSVAEMKQHEVELIELLNTLVPRGYNMTKGGDGTWGRRFSKGTRRRIAETLKRHERSEEHRRRLGESLRIVMRGKRHSEETRRKIAEALKGKKKSSEHRRRMAEGRKAFKGCKHSEESRKRISEALKGRKPSDEHRRRIAEAMRSAWARRKERTE